MAKKITKRKVPLGKAIRWSKMKSKQDIYLEMATPDDTVIEIAKSATVPQLRPFLEAELRIDANAS